MLSFETDGQHLGDGRTVGSTMNRECGDDNSLGTDHQDSEMTGVDESEPDYRMGEVILNVGDDQDDKTSIAYVLAEEDYLATHPNAFVYNGTLRDTLESIAADIAAGLATTKGKFVAIGTCRSAIPARPSAGGVNSCFVMVPNRRDDVFTETPRLFNAPKAPRGYYVAGTVPDQHLRRIPGICIRRSSDDPICLSLMTLEDYADYGRRAQDRRLQREWA